MGDDGAVSGDLLPYALAALEPWPYSPDQAVLIDLAHRRFYMFSIEIWPQEFYFVAGLLIMAGVGLFMVTSAVGRAWCGYACPQTVWTDLFQHIDRWFDGDRNAQFRLAKAPWTASKIARRLAKWSVYLLVSFVTGGAWISISPMRAGLFDLHRPCRCHRLFHRRGADGHHLLAGRLHARTGLRLYVSMAAHPVGHAR
jgi:polyferredoxin